MSQLRFSVGDAVRIAAKEYELSVQEMHQYCGCTTTVSEIVECSSYHLTVDNSYWYWADDWLEPANKRSDMEVML